MLPPLFEPADVWSTRSTLKVYAPGCRGRCTHFEIDGLAGRDGAREHRLAVELADEVARFVVVDADGGHDDACADGLTREPERVAVFSTASGRTAAAGASR